MRVVASDSEDPGKSRNVAVSSDQSSSAGTSATTGEVKPQSAPQPAQSVWQVPGLAPAGNQSPPDGHGTPVGGEEPPPVAMAASAEWGWRGRANRLLNRGSLAFAPTKDERVHRAARRRLLLPFSRTMSIVVANPKGGAAKTPTALLAAATLGFYRGGYTLAWDNNETRGTLGMRAEAAPQQKTVIDLLQHVDDFLASTASVGQLAGYLRPQSARFDVLASDDVAGSMEIIDDVAFSKLWTALSRFYRLMVIDTGNNVRAKNWQTATAVADCLVVPTTVQRDVAESGLWMLDHLNRTGRPDLTKNAVAVISCAEPQPDPQLLDEIVDRYRQVVRDVTIIPHDNLIRSGGRIELDALETPTRRAWLLACSSIIDSLALADQR
ncbi:cobalamin biosynthesis protein CobQ [Micromonospora lupini]|uniref:MinD/ParA family ATP-binding protein n=1 Tax=Micromonospora lupini TaxID=285679 RepID=UPI0033F0E859